MIPIKELAHKERDLIVSLRRHFHEYPELSHNEFATMDYIEARLHEWNIPTVRVPQGGIIATVDSGKPGWTALVRADIDALAIQEKENNLSSKKVVLSKTDGVMHACGHDGHMAMALTEAKILSDHKDAWTGKVLFVFEQAEEIGERGVSQILRYLHDHNIHVDMGYTTHVMWRLPAGKVGIVYDTAMAGAFFFNVTLHGYGGHGSRPDMAKSPIEAFISIQNELRAYRMRAVAPEQSLTYSVGCVNAGSKANIIPSELSFAGTMRCTDNENGKAFRSFFLRRQSSRKISTSPLLLITKSWLTWLDVPWLHNWAKTPSMRTALCGWLPKRLQPYRTFILPSSFLRVFKATKSVAVPPIIHRNSTWTKTGWKPASVPPLPTS